MGRFAQLAGLGLAVMLSGLGGCSKEEAAPAPPVAPKGRLAVVQTGVGDAHLLALDEVGAAEDGVVQATMVTLGKAADGLEGGAAMLVARKGFDCGRGRVRDGTVGAFDAQSKLLSAKVLAAGRKGRPLDGAAEQAVAAIVCEKRPPGLVYADLALAQRQIQMPPQSFEKIAEAHPEDAAAWAWLCARAARGFWRDQAPADCDKAAELNPDAADVHLDRAFLNLMIGRQTVARSGFKAILAREPQNPAALFANGLMAEMAGDKATSKRDRALALKADPQIATWIETRYGLRISPEFRT